MFTMIIAEAGRLTQSMMVIFHHRERLMTAILPLGGRWEKKLQMQVAIWRWKLIVKVMTHT